MTDRIDRYLEGTLERGALTPEERAKADAIGHVIDETRAFVNARPVPDLTARVMCEIDEKELRPAKHPAVAVARWASGLWTPRDVSFRFRPAYGLLAAATVVAVAVLLPSGWRSTGSSGDGPAADATLEPQLFVQFHFQAPDASSVRLAGSFTGWQPRYELSQATPGNWSITLPLPPGVHDYVFVVDGERWTPDPNAQSVDDGFGGTNSRLALLAPESSRL